MNKKISIIACMGIDNEIGLDGGMPWNHFTEDLKHFKKTTLGATIIMGRRTYESIGSKPLIGRKNIVLSHDNDYLSSIVGNGVCVAKSIADGLDMFCSDVFIIGGAQLYEQTIDIVDTMYLTKIYKIFDSDTVFPPIYQDQWATKSIEHHQNEEFCYDFMELERIVE